jgi:RNA:NAD 2'-phosphotransferase (TPT1/KptA family)
MTQHIRISKTLSYLLRHGAEKEGLEIRSDGFMNINTLVNVFLMVVETFQNASSNIGNHTKYC